MPQRSCEPVTAPDAVTTLRMRRYRRHDTAPEIRLRSELHRRGARFRTHREVLRENRCRPDIVFSKRRVAIFVDGCFWHNCARHGSQPKRNAAWWKQKLERNEERDRKNDALLTAAGWLVIRVWEHEDMACKAATIVKLLEARSRCFDDDISSAN